MLKELPCSGNDPAPVAPGAATLLAVVRRSPARVKGIFGRTFKRSRVES